MALAIRKIIVPVDSSPCGRSALSTAFAVAEAFGAHVDAVHARTDPVDALPVVGEGVSGTLVEDLIELTEKQAAARAKAAQQAFEEMRAAAGIAMSSQRGDAEASASFRELVGREGDTVVRLGRLADLIVVGRGNGADAAAAAVTCGIALMQSGRPVLMAGRTIPTFTGDMVIAWNASMESARALSAAMPFLSHATRVIALTADDNSERGLAAATDVTEYLDWHSIKSEPRVVTPSPSVGEALLSAAAGADLLVVGGYSHSRWRELILGGVTQHLLEHATVPLLMTH